MTTNIQSIISPLLYNELKSLSRNRNVSKIRLLLRNNNVLHQLETNAINQAFSFGEYKFVKRHGKFTFNHVKSTTNNNSDSTTSSYYSEYERMHDNIREMKLKQRARENQRRQKILQERIEYEQHKESQM